MFVVCCSPLHWNLQLQIVFLQYHLRPPTSINHFIDNLLHFYLRNTPDALIGVRQQRCDILFVHHGNFAHYAKSNLYRIRGRADGILHPCVWFIESRPIRRRLENTHQFSGVHIEQQNCSSAVNKA